MLTVRVIPDGGVGSFKDLTPLPDRGLPAFLAPVRTPAAALGSRIR